MRTHLGLDSPGELPHPPQLPNQLVHYEQINETHGLAMPRFALNPRTGLEGRAFGRESRVSGVAKRSLLEAKP